MSDLTLREEKGSPLTHEEMDNNFKVLNPVGIISAFARIIPPSGWLECNGQEVSRTEYNNLFEVMGTMCGEGDGINTFNLPDLRGEFIRGWDNGKGIDNLREIGSSQEASIVFIPHNLSFYSVPNHNQQFIDIDNYDEIFSGRQLTDTAYGIKKLQAVLNNATGKVRPRNIALMYCIKY